MKKFWLLILWLSVLLFAWNFSFANDYEYTNLDITADILIDWNMNINEDFTANFFTEKHGIIRNIPLNYSVWWKDFHIEISNINVRWKTFTTSKYNWEVEIKIWDANRTLIWKQNYPISYSTYGLIKNFSGMWYAELYWNLVGYDFDTNINKVYAVINLPKSYTGFTDDDFLITTNWTTTTVKDFQWRVNRSYWDRIIITYDKWLPAYQWITLAIKFPNNYFEFNHKKQAGLIWHTWWNYKSGNFNDLDFLFRKVPIIILIITVIIAIFCEPTFKAKKSHLEQLLNKEDSFLDNSKIKESDIEKKLNDENPIVVRYTPPEWVNCAEAW